MKRIKFTKSNLIIFMMLLVIVVQLVTMFNIRCIKNNTAHANIIEVTLEPDTEEVTENIEPKTEVKKIYEITTAEKIEEPTTEEIINNSEESILTPSKGVNYNSIGYKETYYNLPMSGVIDIMRGLGFDENTYPYWVREDGVKMLGDYVIVAANLDKHSRGSFIHTSLGEGIVCDTGGFALDNPTQIDIAVDW